MSIESLGASIKELREDVNSLLKLKLALLAVLVIGLGLVIMMLINERHAIDSFSQTMDEGFETTMRNLDELETSIINQLSELDANRVDSHD